jgi:hypothetical protein
VADPPAVFDGSTSEYGHRSLPQMQERTTRTTAPVEPSTLGVGHTLDTYVAGSVEDCRSHGAPFVMSPGSRNSSRAHPFQQEHVFV